MPLFQKTIISKYLKTQNSEIINQKWELFKSHFHNPVIQENIRNSKEEQYQGEFLIDLFVNVLGYTKNPTPDFNLTTELKNVKEMWEETLSDLNICSKKGLVEMFDSSIGAGTVTMPFGGKTQLTPIQTMTAKLPAHSFGLLED